MGCPEKNKNYGRGPGLERKRNVKSWEACSALCSKRSDCKYWTWHHDRAGQYSHICKTMTTLQYEREDRNSVSGTRACRPDIQEPDYNYPEKNKNYGRGRGLERKRNVKSWEACSALCSKRSDCKYWTWHHDRAGQYSHICKTMTTLQYEREDRNSVSGTRACRPDIQGSNCIEANIDYLGNDIKRLNSQSALDCACKCREHAGCRFFSWVESKQYCWLKTSDRGRTQKSGVHAGSVDCCKVGRDDFQKF